MSQPVDIPMHNHGRLSRTPVTVNLYLAAHKMQHSVYMLLCRDHMHAYEEVIGVTSN
uniref:Uncharacterized protein n=1 Tax=Thermosporothrix sp. COM3 TaxID=2490863 RepID=A0A455SGD3_9CHLR|nr:hypothetical protein KTC_08230 [Thermosporothrix sp. COM3]